MSTKSLLETLDDQIKRISGSYTNNLNLASGEAGCLATSVYSYVLGNPQLLEALRDMDKVPARDRVRQVDAYSATNTYYEQMLIQVPDCYKPYVYQAFLVSSSYWCLVYLQETVFWQLNKCASGSIAQRCAQWLLQERIRAYRNALAHGNWLPVTPVGPFKYWARKDPRKPGSEIEYSVDQNEVNAWMTLSRGVGYAALLAVEMSEE